MDTPENLKYDYTYRPPGTVVTPAAGRSPVNDLLRPGEHVLWSGQPPQGLIVLRMQDLAVVPFFVAWTGFALFWEAAVVWAQLSSDEGMFGPGLCMTLFGLPFVAIGLYMLVGRFIADVPARRNTHYALTDRRAMIVSGVRNRNVLSVPLDRIENVDLKLHRNGKGTLTFAGHLDAAQLGGITIRSENSTALPSFEQVESPKKVYDLVLKAQDDLTVLQHGYTPEGRSGTG